MKRIINISISIISIFNGLFFSYAFSSLLDFFPWGSRSNYVIWEPLLINYIIPGLILIGVIRLITLKTNNIIFKSLYFSLAFMFYLPISFGFDLETDTFGRWIGVIVSVLSILLATFDIYFIQMRYWLPKK